MKKIAKSIGFKVLGAGKTVTEEQLAKINRLALTQLNAEQVYIREYLMAHNGIDRDVERFSEDLLNDFSRSLPGKGFFIEGHPSSWNGKSGPGRGRWFDAYSKEMTPEEFKTLTDEEIKLPDGVTMAKILIGASYLLKLDSNADLLANIDGGIYPFISIGFKAPRFDVTDDRGNVIYGEYRPNGEALEGSLVWLGAQPGASAMKCEGCKNSAEAQKRGSTEDKTKGDIHMKDFLAKLAKKLGKAFTEENAVDEIAAVISEKDAEIATLKPKAAEGDAYRKTLVEDTVKYGTMIGEIKNDKDSQETEEKFFQSLPIDRLKMFRDKYETQARKSFPDQFTFKSKDESDRQKAEEEARIKAAQVKSKKDYTDPKQNELLSVGK